MADVTTSVRAILEFVDLAVTRRFGSLPVEERERMDALEESLRDLIAGARPAPRSIEGRAAPKKARTGSVPHPGAPASAEETEKARASTAGAPPRVAASTPAVRPVPLSQEDKQKLTEIPETEIARSGYTPPKAPPFLADYYSADLVAPPPGTHLAPKVAVLLGGEDAPEIRPEVRILFGLEQVAAPRRAPTSDVEPTTDAAETRSVGRRSANVHMVAGGIRRGQVATFAPETAVLNLAEDGKGDARIPLRDVLVIAFGPVEGAPPSQPEGRRAVVRLVNGRQVSGLTKDYREGGSALTLTPEERRGNVDYIWIPTTAVQDISVT